MPTETKNLFNTDYSVSSRGVWPSTASVHRPEFPRISTLDNDEANLLLSNDSREFATFSTVADSLNYGRGGLSPEPAGSKAASAPGSTNAFPSHLTEDGISMSPAQSFLSMFSPVAIPEELPDADGQVVAGSYTLDQTVGYGGFSTVKTAYSSTGAVVAVKIIRRADLDSQPDPDEAIRQLDNEVTIWRSLNHEHILPLFVHEHTSYADFFVTLYCPAGSLFDILKRDGNPALPQDDAGTMFRQIVRGIRYLHEVARVVHRDVKLENILVDDTGSCRIGDFNLAKRMVDSRGVSRGTEECKCNLKQDVEDTGRTYDRFRRHTTSEHSNFGPSLHLSLRRPNGPSNRHRASMPFGDSTEGPQALSVHQFQPGSLPYAAPELLSPPSTANCAVHSTCQYPNPAQDMWALGVVLYALLTGRLPFSDGFEPRLQMKILHGVYDIPPGIGHGAEQVLRGCLERSVYDRWTIDMVDEIAWGVGWGLAGDVSGQISPIDDLTHGGHDFRSSRSRSRARPYPDHVHTAAHVMVHNSEGRSSAVSSSSRSRSRSSRAPSIGRTSSERAPSLISSSLHSSLISEDALASPARISTQSLPVSVSRGRPIKKSISGETALSGFSSGSRSGSRSESPTTPAETEVVLVTYDQAATQEPIPVRGRRRDRKFNLGDAQHSGLDVVQEV